MTEIKLHDYQQLASNFILNNRRCGLFLSMGLGKTLLTLYTLNVIRPKGHILIIAPYNIARSTWLDEIEKWGFNITTRSFLIDKKGKKRSRKTRLEMYQESLTASPAMYFINQELVHDLVENMPMQKDPATGKRTKAWPFQTVIIDESQGFKNPSSVRFKALKKVLPAINQLIELTGTPTPQSLLDLWSQVYLLDEGKSLGRTMTEYKNTFFDVVKMYNGVPAEWAPKPGAKEEIYRRIKHIVMSVENTDFKLPPVTINDIRIHLSDTQMADYKEFKSESVLNMVETVEGDNGEEFTISAVNAAVLYSKLIQFASGTIYPDTLPCATCGNDVLNDEEGDTIHIDVNITDHKPVAPNKHQHYKVVHDEKLEHLDYILRNTDSPVCVAYKFVSERLHLFESLKKKGHDVHIFDGSGEMIKAWNDGKLPVILLQPASAAHGLNLQYGGHTLVWYTLPSSLEHYLQTNARFARQGQKHPVTIHRLITAGTQDAKSPSALEGKATNQKDLIDAVRLEIQEDLNNLYHSR